MERISRESAERARGQSESKEGDELQMIEAEGMFCVDNRSYDDVFEVRFTSDKYGEVLSVKSNNLVIVMPYEQIERLIDEERAKRGIPKGI